MTKAEKEAAAAAAAADGAGKTDAPKADAPKTKKAKATGYKVTSPIKTLDGQHEVGEVIAVDAFGKKELAELIAYGALVALDAAADAESGENAQD